MLSIIDEHLREISAFRISTCGSLLASASMDGAVKIWLTSRFFLFFFVKLKKTF